jgi:hypothetical protein
MSKIFDISLKSLLLLNLFDAVFTLSIVTLGWGYEQNPLMAYALSLGPMVFMLTKILLGSCTVWIFLIAYPLKLAVYGAYCVTAVYAALACYHLAFLANFLS